MIDLSTVSRAAIRTDTMLQHPIFLYQVHALGKSGDACLDADTGEESEDAREVFDALDNYAMADFLWKTDRVFATYDEAKAYGESNKHNDGEEGRGWRVYSVPAAGALRQLLEQAMAP